MRLFTIGILIALSSNAFAKMEVMSCDNLEKVSISQQNLGEIFLHLFPGKYSPIGEASCDKLKSDVVAMLTNSTGDFTVDECRALLVEIKNRIKELTHQFNKDPDSLELSVELPAHYYILSKVEKFSWKVIGPPPIYRPQPLIPHTQGRPINHRPTL